MFASIKRWFGAKPRNTGLFIVHGKGYPVGVKTNCGSYPVAFSFREDGLAYLARQPVPCALGTLKEIFEINPEAFPTEFTVLHLSSRQVLEQFCNDPKNFPTRDHLITLKGDRLPPIDNSSAGTRTVADNKQGELQF